jgi:hypothetical protein
MTADPAATFLVMAADADTAAEATHSWRDAGLTVRGLRGRKMKTEDALYDECAAALQFPAYFGENWDALDECLSDIEWLPITVGISLIIHDPLEVLADCDGGLEVFTRILNTAAQTYAEPIALGEWWDRPAVPFHVVLHATAEDVAAVTQRWIAAGASVAADGGGRAEQLPIVLTTLQRALLELGLEDWIPLPEAVTDPVVIEAVGSGDPVEKISSALLELLALGRVEFWSGPWDADPSPVPATAVRRLLLDRRRHSFDAEARAGLDGVYYVNVNNFRSAPADDPTEVASESQRATESDAFVKAFRAWRECPFPSPPDDDDLDDIHKGLIYVDAMVADSAIPYADGREPGTIPTQALEELDVILGLPASVPLGLSEADRLRVTEYAKYAGLLRRVVNALREGGDE